MFHKSTKILLIGALSGIAMALAGCSQIQRPRVEPFYSVSTPPPKQELRWSNGKMPASLDPARAAAAPETDIVRAIYDGLTDLDSRSLRPVGAVAERWEASDDFRTWTFTLRQDARWSNGERVTAEDFVRSWKRLAAMRERAANRFLFKNIIGMREKDDMKGEPGDFVHQTSPEAGPAASPNSVEPFVAPQSRLSAQRAAAPRNQDPPTGEVPQTKPSANAVPKFGVEAVDDLTLRVSLELPDRDLPKLVAHPVFRPVYGDGRSLDGDTIDAAVVTNGVFRLDNVTSDGITLKPSESHWNRRSVALESVRFVPADSAEKALAAYEKGDVDVVTNATFEPLALKLLAPYEDFRRTTHSALNLYEVNTSKPPFSDRRIREALAISIDRTKLTEGDLEGTMQPAHAFSPLSERKKEAVALDVVKAKDLLEKAGYQNAAGFPRVRLVINRNDTQQRVARSISRMWQQNLNIDTEIIVKETADIASVREAGDFDLIRRGVVLPVNDELVNLTSVLGSAKKPVRDAPATPRSGPSIESLQGQGPTPPDANAPDMDGEEYEDTTALSLTITEADAIFDLRVIPLYFPMSYALVKPYVRGFEMNPLDAPSLKEMSIDTAWQPRK